MEKRNEINKKYYESSKEYCSCCKIDVSKAGKAYHYSSKKHLANLEKMNGEFNAISILEGTLAKLKDNPTNQKDICIELINTLTTSLDYKPQVKVEEVVEKEVVERPKKIIVKKKQLANFNTPNTIENALLLDVPLSKAHLDLLDRKWKEVTKEVETQEYSRADFNEIVRKPHEELVPEIYTRIYEWFEYKICQLEEVTTETYFELHSIIIDKILEDTTDTNLEEKQKKVITFCYWKMILEEGWKNKM